MSPNPTHQNSGSEEEPQVMMDQRKRKRMLSNRESARRSRMRKQQHLDELINQVSQLKNENNQISMQVNLFMQQHTKLQSENSFLRTQMNGLVERLQSMNSVLRFVAESSGVPMDMPDPLLEPWQLTYLMQPIVASTDMF